MIAIESLKEFQVYIIRLIQNTTNGKYSVHLPEFNDPSSMDLNEDLENTIKSLSNVADIYKREATYIIDSINEYIKKTMLPVLLQLEIIIIINAFLDQDSKIIIDLFYTNTVENERILRTPKDFCKIMNSPLMVFFYKVSS